MDARLGAVLEFRESVEVEEQHALLVPGAEGAGK